MSNTLRGSFRASSSASQELIHLGPLANLPGTWVGKGFNLIAVPNGQNNNQPQIFRLMLNSTVETLTFTPLGGPVPNRGGEDSQGAPVKDIFFKGLHYFQHVSDAKTFGALHAEPGLWLHLLDGVVRLGTVPHGDSLLAQGTGVRFPGGPTFEVADPTPFVVDDSGTKVPITFAPYLEAFHDAALRPEGITEADVMNPNLLLESAIAGQTIEKTTELKVDSKNSGGILNIPFVTQNANVTEVSSIFWVEKVINADGTNFMQLQYTQTVMLDFGTIPGGDPKQIIKWPHISVATLIKQ